MVLISLIDDATGYIMSRFYPEGTVEAHMDLAGRWLRRFGRPVAFYTDRHSIFEPHDKGRALPDAETQFGRALRELGIELIWAHSPQAKGRVERSFGTAQDRWVKELRLAKVCTVEEANKCLERVVPAHNRRFAKKAKQQNDAHRPLGPSHDLEAILSIQEERTVTNDYTVRFRNRFYQLLPPALPGLRGGKVVIECRLDGTMAIRFQSRHLKYKEIVSGGSRVEQGPAEVGQTKQQASEQPNPPTESSAEKFEQAEGGGDGEQPEKGDATEGRRKPAEDHPWRKGFKGKR